MLMKVLIGLGALLAVACAGILWMTRGGSPTTPIGKGTVETASGTFEAFPLPDYAAKVLPADHKSYFVEVEPGIKIHVIEVGTGYPVYLQHGNPTNGLLYRKIITQLPTDRVRLVMPTMVGLGFSSKVPASAHTLDNNIRWMNAALRELKLGKLVYVAQDWGGPVGMGALMRSPGMVEGLVILNTSFSAPKEAFELSRPHAIAATPIVGELVIENLVSFFDRLKDMQGDPASIPPEVAALYARPVVESGNRKAPLALMRMVPTGPAHPSHPQQSQIEAYAETLDVPAEIVWGMSDPIFARTLPVMERMFPKAKVTRTSSGHFLQEEVPEVIAAAVMRVLDEVQKAGPQPTATAAG
jgi:haloalkane dehalogenase